MELIKLELKFPTKNKIHILIYWEYLLVVKKVCKNRIDTFWIGIDKFDVEMELTPCLFVSLGSCSLVCLRYDQSWIQTTYLNSILLILFSLYFNATLRMFIKVGKLVLLCISGKVSNIPCGMVTDQFGMVGLLTFIRAAETDPNLVALASGIDLTTLGLNLNSPE